MSSLTAIDHVGIAVDDLEAAVEHYPTDARREADPP